MRRVLTLLLLAAASPGPALAAEPQNHCRDPAAEAQWAELLAKNSGDLAVQALHALRVGLCLKVERGDLTLTAATEIFENARRVLVEQRQGGGDGKTRL